MAKDGGGAARRRTQFTDKKVDTLKPNKDGTRKDYPDPEAVGLFVRVSPRSKSFVLYTRLPDSDSPTRLALGEYGVLSLADARKKARRWKALIKDGKDPREEEARQREEERLAQQRKRANSFAAVAEDFIIEKLGKREKDGKTVYAERKGREVERDIRRDLVPPLGHRPITEISARDVADVIKEVKTRGLSQAHNVLGHAKRLFGWAVDQHAYGLDTSPADRLKPKALIGKKAKRTRALNDDELFACWRAAKRMPYPHGPVYQLLVLAGVRLNEAADASWPEFHREVVRALRQRKDGEAVDWSRFNPEHLVWVIPAERMKGENDEARPHAVPLTPDILRLLETLPIFKSGDFLFSTSFGKSPVWMTTKVKRRLDARMLRTLKALARLRDDDPDKVTLPHWENHDLRRVVRSRLSRIRDIEDHVREAVLAHAQPGIKGVYDVHDYFDEKREALNAWHDRLRSIVDPAPSVEPPPPDNVVLLKREMA